MSLEAKIKAYPDVKASDSLLEGKPNEKMWRE